MLQDELLQEEEGAFVGHVLPHLRARRAPGGLGRRSGARARHRDGQRSLSEHRRGAGSLRAPCLLPAPPHIRTPHHCLRLPPACVTAAHACMQPAPALATALADRRSSLIQHLQPSTHSQNSSTHVEGCVSTITSSTTTHHRHHHHHPPARRPPRSWGWRSGGCRWGTCGAPPRTRPQRTAAGWPR